MLEACICCLFRKVESIYIGGFIAGYPFYILWHDPFAPEF
jgi:hypothetical protein